MKSLFKHFLPLQKFGWSLFALFSFPSFKNINAKEKANRNNNFFFNFFFFSHFYYVFLLFLLDHFFITLFFSRYSTFHFGGIPISSFESFSFFTQGHQITNNSFFSQLCAGSLEVAGERREEEGRKKPSGPDTTS